MEAPCPSPTVRDTLRRRTAPPARAPCPVISYPTGALDDPASFRADLLAALADVCDAPKAPVRLTVYCREDIGLDALKQPAHILYFYVVGSDRQRGERTRGPSFRHHRRQHLTAPSTAPYR
jgi:hypothetical protein